MVTFPFLIRNTLALHTLSKLKILIRHKQGFLKISAPERAIREISDSLWTNQIAGFPYSDRSLPQPYNKYSYSSSSCENFVHWPDCARESCECPNEALVWSCGGRNAVHCLSVIFGNLETQFALWHFIVVSYFSLGAYKYGVPSELFFLVIPRATVPNGPPLPRNKVSHVNKHTWEKNVPST